MELKLSKSTQCSLNAKGSWGNRAAAWMGLSFFLRMVYYFGLVNLNDVPGLEIAFSVVLSLAVSVGLILMLKLDRLNYPIAAAGLAVAFAVFYFFNETMNFGGIVSGFGVLALAGMILAAVLGYVPERKWMLWCAAGVLIFRVLFVDLIGHILPLGEFGLVAYVPKASNLFGILSLACLAGALELKQAE